MHIEFLLEELSMESALRFLVPKIVPGHSFALHPHQGKEDLLGGGDPNRSKLARRLRGYKHWGVPDLRVCVVVDRDGSDCHDLKQRLVTVSHDAGVASLSRIAIEELEAWFFGDPEALRGAYPRLPATFSNKAAFRDPDAIAGGTWEALERLLQRAGYFRGGMPKVEVAEAVAARMDPERNSSRSFQVFRDGLRRLAAPVGQ